MSSDKTNFDVIESIEKHISQLKQGRSKQALVCIGEYPAKILLKGTFINKMNETQSIFIDKSSRDIAKWSQSTLDPNNILGLDENIDTHFWFNVLPHLTDNETFITRLKNKLAGNVQGAILVSSLWDGVGSALLPALISQFKEWNIDSIALALLPSKVQPSDANFNALSSVGMGAAKDFATFLLIERDKLERYVGVNRNGLTIEGNIVVNYVLEVMLAKETIVQELSELSRAFNVKIYTLLPATGASLKIYGSLENILDATLLRPVLTFDLSSASLLYVLIRMPLRLKDKLPRGKIELAIAKWFKEKVNLKSIYVTEPIYVEEANDRIDLIMFVGGFDVIEMFSSLEKKVNAIKNQAVKKGLIKEDEWKDIVKSLVES
jgi:hypothetical protein